MMDDILLWVFGWIFILCVAASFVFFGWVIWMIVQAINETFKFW